MKIDAFAMKALLSGLVLLQNCRSSALLAKNQRPLDLLAEIEDRLSVLESKIERNTEVDAGGVFVRWTQIQAGCSRGVVPFSIDGKDYLYVPSCSASSSVVYQVRESVSRSPFVNPLLSDFQHIYLPSSHKAAGAEFIKIGHRHFLATSYIRGSRIHEWNAKQSRFVLFQDVSFKGNVWHYGAKHVHIDQRHFLIFPFFTPYHLSEVHYWNGTQFAFYDKLPVSADVNHFAIGKEHYIGFASRSWGASFPHLTPKIFKWTGDHFVLHQTFTDKAKRAFSMTTYTVGSLTYLAVSYHNFKTSTINNYNTTSNIYVWNTKVHQFVRVQSFPTIGAAEIIAFKIGKQQYLSVANLGNANIAVKSVIYRVTGPELIVHQELLTLRALQLQAFHHKGHVYLAVSTTTADPTIIYQWQSP
eukprot:m.170780 g.170780  ORF g.170780 m.170780 type:complete len:414 (+) comp39046_c0_seq30:187-1428(+)